MPDPLAAKTVDVAAKSVGGVLDKLLGPTAEIMGQQLADRYTRRLNAQRVITRAAERTDLASEGAIPARVAVDLLEQAQWAENEFLAEYLSGVLASARTVDGTNDESISWTTLVGRLSSDQLALHWVLYSGFQKLVRDTDREHLWDWTRRQLIVDYWTLLETLGWPLYEDELPRLMESAYGLRRENLLADLTHGDGEYLRTSVSWTRGKRLNENKGYLSFKVTADGIGLLLRGVGQGRRWYGDVYDSMTSRAIDETDALPKSPPIVFLDSLPDFDDAQSGRA